MTKWGLIAAIATALIGGGTWAGGIGAVSWLDSRYAPLAAVQDLAWSQLKRDIRDLRERIAAAQNPQLRGQLEADLRDLIDRFCRSYPDDRECR